MLNNKQPFIHLTLICFFFLFHGQAAAGEKTVARPLFESIRPFMLKSGCLMKKETRKKLASAIQELDRHHVRFLHNRGYSLQAPPDTEEQIEARTGILPAAVTICERAIIYSLFLQIDMLDNVLSQTDNEKAAQLKEARRRKKRLDPADRIYGDYRDVYFYLVMDTLKDISELQACFGAGDATDWPFPRGLEKSRTEFFILIKIRQVSSKAETLSNKK